MSEIDLQTNKAPRGVALPEADLYASKVLEAAGAWDRSSIIDVSGARWLTLIIDYTAHASAAGGYPEIVPMRAFTAVAPAAGDATWRCFSDRDVLADSSAALTGTLPAGTDFTAGPAFSVVKMRDLLLSIAASTAGSQRKQMTVKLDVGDARFVQLMAHEKGDTTNIGTLNVKFVVSA